MKTNKNYKYFHENNLCQESDQILIQDVSYRSSNLLSKLTEILSILLEKHAPIKSKNIRDNHALFMSKELSKIIMEKSKAQSKHLKWSSRENYVKYKKIKNKCNQRNQSKNVNTKEDKTSKVFSCAVKLLITNKGAIKIPITVNVLKQTKKPENEKEGFRIKANDLNKDEKLLVKIFNQHYINILERTPGSKSTREACNAKPKKRGSE